MRGVARTIQEHFCRFAPEDLVRFDRADEAAERLEPGDEVVVHIRLAGTSKVRVVHRDEQSLTLATLEGHPEAGRITFGAYPNDDGDIVVHIRSRARSASSPHELAFFAVGEPMQTDTWSEYIDRLAAAVAEGVRGVIHVETHEVEETDEDRGSEPPRPTFRAVGDSREKL